MVYHKYDHATGITTKEMILTFSISVILINLKKWLRLKVCCFKHAKVP